MRLGELVSHRVERLGHADAGHDVLALRVLQEVAVRQALARRRVARERDTRARVVALVAEHHRLHVDRRAEVVGDALEAAVVAGPLAVPRLEHGLDRVPELLLGIGRELDAVLGPDDALERLDQSGEILGRELGLDADAPLVDEIVQRLLEQVARHVQDDLGEHLHEAAVRVVREALVLCLARQALHRLVVQAEVQHRVHHPGHRERRARAHGHEQRVLRVAEPLRRLLLERFARGGDLVHQPFGQAVDELHVVVARVGRDREAGRDRQPEVRHLGEVGALAAQEELLLLRTFLEREDVFRHREPFRTDGR